MLRIKKDVDLKELINYVKKYGEIKKLFSKETGKEMGYTLFLKKVGNYGEWFELKNGIFEIEKKQGYYDSCATRYYHSEMVHLLFDLIQAGLVEKVSEGDNE